MLACAHFTSSFRTDFESFFQRRDGCRKVGPRHSLDDAQQGEDNHECSFRGELLDPIWSEATKTTSFVDIIEIVCSNAIFLIVVCILVDFLNVPLRFGHFVLESSVFYSALIATTKIIIKYNYNTVSSTRVIK